MFISKKRGEVFGYNKERESCYATYMYPSWAIFSQYFLIFIFSPLLYSIIQYVVLLYRSKKKVGHVHTTYTPHTHHIDTTYTQHTHNLHITYTPHTHHIHTSK